MAGSPTEGATPRLCPAAEWSRSVSRCLGAGKRFGMWVQVAAGLGRGHAVEIGDEPVTLGSGPGCALVLGGPGVEPLHVSRVGLPEGRVELRDLNPGAGATFVDAPPSTEAPSSR